MASCTCRSTFACTVVVGGNPRSRGQMTTKLWPSCLAIGLSSPSDQPMQLARPSSCRTSRSKPRRPVQTNFPKGKPAGKRRASQVDARGPLRATWFSLAGSPCRDQSAINRTQMLPQLSEKISTGLVSRSFTTAIMLSGVTITPLTPAASLCQNPFRSRRAACDARSSDIGNRAKLALPLPIAFEREWPLANDRNASM